MPTYADPIQYPLAAPTVSTTTYTVDFLLANPTRITRIVNDLTLSNFFLDDIFTIGGDVQGGALLYDQATTLDTYTDRDVERIEPGTEAPIVGGVRTAPLVAQVEKFGGKFVMVAEAIRRNDQSRMRNQTRRLANTIVRKMHQRGLAELAANISTFSRTATGVSWSDALALTMTTAAANNMPGYDFAAVQTANENAEMGYAYDTLIVNPTEALSLRAIYKGELSNVLRDNGITTFISTPRKSATSAYFLAGGAVGEMRLEEPLRTNVANEVTSAPTMVEQTWVQSLVNPVMAVTDPYAILEVTALEA
jgi:hypothetical protein